MLLTNGSSRYIIPIVDKLVVHMALGKLSGFKLSNGFIGGIFNNGNINKRRIFIIYLYVKDERKIFSTGGWFKYKYLKKGAVEGLFKQSL
ncbi:MAG TPA: hypothetical protein GX707_09720 [Epulopiscium sp.]|nr:hypothetical protein [Candidatus Epulonipiscium sp.]